MEIDPLDMNGGVVPPRISWAAVVYSFFHSFASQESQQHFFLDYLERKVTGSRDRWKHVILLDAMMCLVHGKTQTRPYIAQERGFCHHAAFQNAVIVAMEAAVEGNTTSPTRSAPNHMESSNAKQPTSHRSNSTRSSPDRGSSSNKSSKQAGKNPVDSNNLGGPFTEKELEVAKNSWLHGLICNASEEKLAQARSSADYSEHYGVTEDNRTEALGDEYLWLFEPPDTGASSSSKFGEVKPSMDWNGKGVPRKWEIQSFSSPVAVSPLENVPLVSLGLLRDIHSPWFEFKHFRDGFLTLMYETHIYGPETSAVQNHRYTAHRMQVLDDYGRSPALSTGTLAELCVRACECALQQTVNGTQAKKTERPISWALKEPAMRLRMNQGYSEYMLKLGFPPNARPGMQEQAFARYLKALQVVANSRSGSDIDTQTVHLGMDKNYPLANRFIYPPYRPLAPTTEDPKIQIQNSMNDYYRKKSGERIREVRLLSEANLQASGGDVKRKEKEKWDTTRMRIVE